LFIEIDVEHRSNTAKVRQTNSENAENARTALGGKLNCCEVSISLELKIASLLIDVNSRLTKFTDDDSN
jgi:hypothetical protein